MSVGLVLVSHSPELARGVAELAAQMGPSVPIRPAGGMDDGSIGTSFDLILAALTEADAGDGAVVLYDLGSALLTAETAVEFLDPEAAARVRIVDAPLVEAALAAAVAAEGGGDLEAVAAAAGAAAGQWGAEPSTFDPPSAVEAERIVEIANPLGIHARPAAQLAREASAFDASVTVARAGEEPVLLQSVLAVVGRAFRGGDIVMVGAAGRQADEAVERVAALIASGFGERGEPEPAVPASALGAPRLDDGVLTATPGSVGVALGVLRRVEGLPTQVAARIGADPAAEGERLDSAIAATAAALSTEGDFGGAHAALLRDPTLRKAAEPHLGQGAGHAWWQAVAMAAADLAGTGDELVAARAADVREAGAAVLAHLGVAIDVIPDDISGQIVLVDDLGPARVPRLIAAGAAGAVLRQGSGTSHAVIVARGLGFPLVVRVGAALDEAVGHTVVIDGGAGVVRVDPSDAAEIRARVDNERRAAAELRARAQEPVVLPGGRSITVAANVGSVADARAAVENGADAVGLLRTELLVLDAAVFPDEDAQTADLAEIFEVLGGRPITVRVLDAGGDKPVATLDVGPEHNGFLGVRGLRYLLQHPDILRTQLRAIMRASVGHRVSVMAPMVSVPSEAEAFRHIVEEVSASLRAEGVPFCPPEAVGIMVEVPAAALTADRFAGAADFFSVGSNDLTSYVMAAERTEPGVADLLDPGAPAVQRLLDQLTAFASAVGIQVSVCGEMAGDERLVGGLVARGVAELSMAPSRIPRIKHHLRQSSHCVH